MSVENINEIWNINDALSKLWENVWEFLKLDTFVENHNLAFCMFCEKQLTPLLAQKNLLPPKSKNPNILSA